MADRACTGRITPCPITALGWSRSRLPARLRAPRQAGKGKSALHRASLQRMCWVAAGFLSAPAYAYTVVRSGGTRSTASQLRLNFHRRDFVLEAQRVWYASPIPGGRAETITAVDVAPWICLRVCLRTAMTQDRRRVDFNSCRGGLESAPRGICRRKSGGPLHMTRDRLGSGSHRRQAGDTCVEIRVHGKPGILLCRHRADGVLNRDLGRLRHVLYKVSMEGSMQVTRSMLRPSAQ